MNQSTTPHRQEPDARNKFLSVIKIITYCASVISIIGLMKHVFMFNFSPILDALTTLVDKVLDKGFVPLGSAISLALGYLGLEIQLHSSWKYILILSMLYYGADAYQGYYLGLREGGSREAHRSAIFHGSLGAALALLSAVVAGSLLNSNGDLLASFFVAVCAISGLFFYAVIGRWRQYLREIKRNRDTDEREIPYVGESERSKKPLPYFKERVFFAAFRTVVFVSIVILFLSSGFSEKVLNPGVASFAVFVFLLPFYWLCEAVWHALDRNPTEHDTFRSAYFKTGPYKVARDMLVTYMGVIVALSITAFGGLF